MSEDPSNATGRGGAGGDLQYNLLPVKDNGSDLPEPPKPMVTADMPNRAEETKSDKADTSPQRIKLNRKLSHQMKEFANAHHLRSSATMPMEEEEVIAQREASFIFSNNGLTSDEAAERLKKFGKNELPEKKVPKWYIYVKQLWEPMPIMIWIAVIIEAGIQNWIDMAILIFIQFSNATIGYYEITKAGDAVEALKKSLKPTATVRRDGKFVNMDATNLVPGDLVLLASGSAVPADCRVNEGEIEVDEAALTGESLPVTIYQGKECKMGSTVVRGEVHGTVAATGANTFFGRTAALLQVSFPLCRIGEGCTLLTCSCLLWSPLVDSRVQQLPEAPDLHHHDPSGRLRGAVPHRVHLLAHERAR
jgi:magnesium-transporting ATPase (P-type)